MSDTNGNPVRLHAVGLHPDSKKVRLHVATTLSGLQRISYNHDEYSHGFYWAELMAKNINRALQRSLKTGEDINWLFDNCHSNGVGYVGVRCTDVTIALGRP